MTYEELLRLFQLRVVQGAIGPSSMRNQGSPDVVRRARSYLGELDLARFCVDKERKFRARLDEHTESLRKALPAHAKHYGTSRKAMNLFLRDVLYHRYLCEAYEFNRLEPWLEVPLDSYVAKGIRRSCLDDVPRWPGIIHLDPETGEEYQAAARRIAFASRVCPVHLDVYWWRNVGESGKPL